MKDLRSRYFLSAKGFTLLIGLSLAAVVVLQIVSGQNTSSNWTMYQHDSRHSGTSTLVGPQTNSTTVLYDFGLDSSSASPVVGPNGLIYFAKNVTGGGFSVVALTSSGTLVWESPIYQLGNALAPLTIADDGTIYVPAGAGNQTTYLHALFPDGTLKWTKTFNGFANPVPIGSDGTLYVASGFWQTSPDSLTALNPDGTTKWSYDFGSVNALQPAAVAPNGIVIVSDNGNNFVEAHDPVNGNLLWQIFLGSSGGMSAPAIAADGTIYVFASRLWAISAGGEVLWTTPVMPTVTGSTPAIAGDGSVFFATVDPTPGGLTKLLSYTPAGQLRWSSDLAQNVGAAIPQVALDSDGAAYVSLKSASNSPVPLSAVNNDGSHRWTHTASFLNDIVIGEAGKAFVLLYDQSSKIISLGSSTPTPTPTPIDSRFLVFPLAGQTPFGAIINSVFDHSQNSPYNDNGIVVAFTGESGECQSGSPNQIIRSQVNGTSHYGFRNFDGAAFSVNGNYVGGGSNCNTSPCNGKQKLPNLACNTFLFYDGHPGIDYNAACGTNVYASVSGTVHYPTSIPGIRDSYRYHVLEIVPDEPYDNYRVYYLHMATHISVDSKHVVACVNEMPIVQEGQHVTAGVTIIGRVGSAGISKTGAGKHLHFEVHIKNGIIGIPVDPYGWSGSYPDPYSRATNKDLWK